MTGLFAAGGGPVLVAWPELPRWRPEHAEGALGDLEDGCAVSFGPMFDGGFYLVAFAQPVPALLDLDDDAWLRSDPIALAADAARDAGLAIGLLRTERGLRTAADVRRAAGRSAARRSSCARFSVSLYGQAVAMHWGVV